MKKMMTVVFASALAANALALTTNVSTVAELAGAVEYLNSDAGSKSSNTIRLAAGSYDLTDLHLFYWRRTTPAGLYDGSSNISVSYFTLQGATDNPRDTVLYTTDGSLRLIYNYAGTVRDLTLSNVVNTAADGPVVGNVNKSAIYTNVLVTCCKGKNGGVAGSGTWLNCAFVGNSATKSGGAIYGSGPVVENCRFEGNEATEDGGGTYSTSTRGCAYVGNRARNGGAVSGGGHVEAMIVSNASTSVSQSYGGGGAYSCGLTNCLVWGNSANFGGGVRAVKAAGCVIVSNVVSGSSASGGGAYDSQLTNCLVVCNRAGDWGGGVFGSSASGATAVDCVISNNWAGFSGGGVYGGTVESSRICMNTVEGYQSDQYTTGAGSSGNANLTNCLVDGNALYGLGKNFMGGGVYNTTAVDCRIFNNYSQSLGPAAANSLLEGCVVSNNVSSGGASAIRAMSGSHGGVKNGVRNCTFYETALDLQSWMDNSRVMNYTNGNVVAAGANVYTNGWFSGPNVVLTSYCAVTNCLFTGNTCQGIVTSSKSNDTCLANCTVAGNHLDYFATGFNDGVGSALTVDNCLIAENTKRDGTGSCNLRTSFGNVKWSNTLVGSVDCSVNYKYPMSNMITNANPRFVGAAADPENPYALRHSSPARGKGAVYGWMSAATDIRGCPRLRDGLVDLGCYECWLDPVGALLLLR